MASSSEHQERDLRQNSASTLGLSRPFGGASLVLLIPLDLKYSSSTPNLSVPFELRNLTEGFLKRDLSGTRDTDLIVHMKRLPAKP